MTTSPGYDYDTGIPAGFYDQIHRRGAGVRYSWHDLKFRAVAARLGGVRRLLDVGCGPGTFIGNYAGGIEALGIDASAPQVAYAQRTYGSDRHRFATRTVADLAAAGEHFDAVTLVELVEHLEPAAARALLAGCRGLLAPGGRLVLTTPNYGSLWPAIEWGLNRASSVRYEAQHVNRYRSGRLAADLAAAGFASVAVTTIVGFAPFAAVLGQGAMRGLDAVERRIRHLGLGHLLLAEARP